MRDNYDDYEEEFLEYMEIQELIKMNSGDGGGGGKGACYIATCVYGSYDCPQVWVLRRFRDNILAAKRLGRWFIKLYYAISPGLVARFGKRQGMRRLWQYCLDPVVKHLRAKGLSDTPYQDRISF